MKFTRPHERHDWISLQLCKLAATRIREKPTLIKVGMRNIRRWVEGSNCNAHRADVRLEWAKLIECHTAQEIADLLEAEGDEPNGCALQCPSFNLLFLPRRKGCKSLKALTRNDLILALDKCSALTGDREFVVVGSVSILGSKPSAPRRLMLSADIDLFPRFGESGEKNELIDKSFGQGSQFELENNFYIEGVGSWTMMTSPPEWEKRMTPITTPSGAIGWCLSPFDLAYNKLETGREKDLQYIGEMVRSRITPAISLRAFLRQNAPNQGVLERLEKNLQRAGQTAKQRRGLAM